MIFYDDDHGNDVTVYLAVPVTQPPAELPEPAKYIVLPAVEAAVAVRSGPAASIFPMVYHDLAQWAGAHGHQACGPCRQIWVHEVDDIADASQQVLEIQLPFFAPEGHDRLGGSLFFGGEADTGIMRYLAIDVGKKISRIGLGTWQFGSREWGYGEGYAGQVAYAVVRRALELGVTLFDTAEVYGFGRSERILGRALGDERESVFVATKIFPVVPVAPVVEQRAVASADRLGVRRLDLYQVHQPNPLVRDGTIMRGMRALQRVGLVGEVGVSNYSLERWRAAEAALGSRVLSNQVRYSLVSRSPERDLLPFAESHGRIVIAYSPLAQGLLSGRYDRASLPGNRVRATNPLFLPDNLDRAGDLMTALREVADAHAATPAQIALAWVLHHPAVVAIPGASSVEQLESNAVAAEIDLTDQEYDALQAASDRFRPVVGAAALPRLVRARFGR